MSRDWSLLVVVNPNGWAFVRGSGRRSIGISFKLIETGNLHGSIKSVQLRGIVCQNVSVRRHGAFDAGIHP